MRTIQMTLDDDLVKAVDRVSKELCTSRSAFARKALRDALARHKLEELERKHRRGYERAYHPVQTVWDPVSALFAQMSQAVYNFYNLPTQ